ncbi:MAG: SDR family oxidoreductase [Thermoanaerobaculia bacterium]
MRVLVTGVDGYIGSLLAPLLLQKGWDVVGLDTGYYREGWLYNDPEGAPVFPKVLTKDLRMVDVRDLEGFDAVVHLAELSNDPLGANNPTVTNSINHLGSVRLATLAKKAGTKRFVYTSSCSVYGLGTGHFLSEEDEVNPQTTYAECKVLVERDVTKLADSEFSPTFLRNATAYGASPRMRFDIVLNNLCGHAWTTSKIAMTSDGTPWRPLTHVLDICGAILCTLKAPRESVSGEIFNVGHNADNHQIREIAEIVAEVFPDCQLSVGPSGGDDRSYRVSFDKISQRLPDFRCRWAARQGAEQLRNLFERIDMPQETFEFRAFTRLKQLEFLIRTKQIDQDFFWRE